MKSIESVKTLKYKMGIRIQTVLKIRPASMCLVTGCPRSGTSAILSWLNQNKGVVRFYESRILVSAHRFYSEIERFNNLNQNKEFFLGEIRKLVLKYYDSKKLLIAKHLIDKEPLEPIAFPDLDYALFLSNLREIFPDIKLLFMVRNPVETIWSMMNRKWGYTLTSQELRQFTLDECIQTWNACAGLAQKYAKRKKVFVCRFERLVEDPQTTSNQVLRFIGLKTMPPFKVKPTRITNFSESEKRHILRETSLQMEEITTLGV